MKKYNNYSRKAQCHGTLYLILRLKIKKKPIHYDLVENYTDTYLTLISIILLLTEERGKNESISAH